VTKEKREKENLEAGGTEVVVGVELLGRAVDSAVRAQRGVVAVAATVAHVSALDADDVGLAMGQARLLLGLGESRRRDVRVERPEVLLEADSAEVAVLPVLISVAVLLAAGAELGAVARVAGVAHVHAVDSDGLVLAMGQARLGRDGRGDVRGILGVKSRQELLPLLLLGDKRVRRLRVREREDSLSCTRRTCS
jgi:hypothetical protein